MKKCILFICILLNSVFAWGNGSSSATPQKNEQVEVAQMRLTINGTVFYGLSENDLNKSVRDIRTQEIVIQPGESLQLKVELLDDLGNATDITHDPKTVYHSRRSVIKVSDTGQLTAVGLDDDLRRKIDKNLIIKGHLAVYYNLVDKRGRKIKNPDGKVAAAVAWFILSK